MPEHEPAGPNPGSSRQLYAGRKLADGYPDLDRLAFEKFEDTVRRRPDDSRRVETLLMYIGRLIDLEGSKDIAVVGCGPRPQPIRVLLDRGHRAIGIEPVPLFVKSANEYLDASQAVRQGAAEAMPLDDDSCDLLVFESVLEHVDSPRAAMDEIYRVLRPGGVAYVTTTNRLRFSPVGRNGEFNVRFYNWLPDLVKESLVFRHLHYEPALSNFTERPAVHWWTYADLCKLGRDSRFAQFYSVLDLVRTDDPNVARSSLRRFLVRQAQGSAWLRALALTQIGGVIFMLKRR